jgi:hypothetical protein
MQAISCPPDGSKAMRYLQECAYACLAHCARRAQSALRTGTPFSNRGCLETIQGSTLVSASTSPRTHAQVGAGLPLETVTQSLFCVEWGLSTSARTTSVSRSLLHCFCIEPPLLLLLLPLAHSWCIVSNKLLRFVSLPSYLPLALSISRALSLQSAAAHLLAENKNTTPHTSSTYAAPLSHTNKTLKGTNPNLWRRHPRHPPFPPFPPSLPSPYPPCLAYLAYLPRLPLHPGSS